MPDVKNEGSLPTPESSQAPTDKPSSATPTFDAANKYAHEHFSSWSDRYEYLMGEFKRLERTPPSAELSTSDRYRAALVIAKQALQDVRQFTIGEQSARGHLSEQASYVRRINGCEQVAKNAQTLIHDLLGREPVTQSASGACDSARLLWLETLLKHCPHAELKYNDDPEPGEYRGWTLTVESCSTLSLEAPTLEELIDIGMVAVPDEDGNVHATAGHGNDHG